MLLRLLALASSFVPPTLTVPTFSNFNSRAKSNTRKNAYLTASRTKCNKSSAGIHSRTSGGKR